MNPLHRLRRDPRWAALLLLWWVAQAVVAAAAPAWRAPVSTMVCTSAGMVMPDPAADAAAGDDLAGQTHCPLCLMPGAPPAALRSCASVPVPGLPRLVGVAADTPLRRACAPLPARGPPLSS